jgi:hypothetical protein
MRWLIKPIIHLIALGGPPIIVPSIISRFAGTHGACHRHDDAHRGGADNACDKRFFVVHSGISFWFIMLLSRSPDIVTARRPCLADWMRRAGDRLQQGAAAISGLDANSLCQRGA